jgi:hypothetical protein
VGSCASLDPNDVYTSFSRFWSSVASVATLTLLTLLVLRYVVGVRLRPLSRIKDHLDTDAGKEQRELLEDFHLWSKLPYLAVLALVCYFILFNSFTDLTERLVTSDALRFSTNPVEIAHARIYTSDLATITAYALRDPQMRSVVTEDGDGRAPTLFGIVDAESRFADAYRSRSPSDWQDGVGWAERRSGDAVFVQDQMLLLILVVIVAAVVLLARLRPSPTPLGVWRGVRLVLVLAVAVVLVLPALRYRAEDAYLEARQVEYGFVARQLAEDPRRVRLSDEVIGIRARKIDAMLATCRVPDEEVPFWLERRVAGTEYGALLRHLALVRDPYEVNRYGPDGTRVGQLPRCT